MNLNYYKAIQSLAPGAQFAVTDEDYDSIQWVSTDIAQPSKAAVDAAYVQLQAQEPLNATKDQAKARIAASDWSVLPDVGLSNQADFVAYRSALRALITNPVVNPSWPVEPQPVWS